eukprot:12723736-Alexandrium_andersonii.AAC.1
MWQFGHNRARLSLVCLPDCMRERAARARANYACLAEKAQRPTGRARKTPMPLNTNCNVDATVGVCRLRVFARLQRNAHASREKTRRPAG